MTKKKKKSITLQSFVQSLMQAKPEVRALYMASGVLLLSGLLLLIWFATRSFSPPLFVDEIDEGNDGIVVVKECPYRRVLDGVCVGTPEERVVPVIAVMIENHTEARPQSGLARASVVYEVPVEGNYSRFLALFPMDLEIGKVGPVRSARPYFLDWVREYGTPMYMHVGGSPASLAMLRDTATYFDFNEFYRGQYFWRSTDRRAPHNTYTSSENWQAGWERYVRDDVYVQSSASWVYGEVEACTDTCVSRVTVSFAPPTYQAVWTYTTSSQQFLRAQAGRPHSDQDGVQISADTVVVQYVTTRVLDNEGRLSMDTIGTGDALVFVKGNMIEGVWKKESIDEKTRFFDMNGEEIVFSPGNIWIEVVNQIGSVEIE